MTINQQFMNNLVVLAREHASDYQELCNFMLRVCDAHKLEFPPMAGIWPDENPVPEDLAQWIEAHGGLITALPTLKCRKWSIQEMAKTNIWFVSDTHFAHGRILTIEDRPFKTVEEMDEAIINNWNSYVKKKDTVYHIGDFSFRKADKYLARLNGFVHLIQGNHDASAHKHRGLFPSFQDMMYLQFGEQKVHLCHYKFTVWWCSRYGAWNVFGHSHGRLGERLTPGRTLDVGIMQKKWAPNMPWLWHYNEVAEYMRDKPLLNAADLASYENQHEEGSPCGDE